MSRFSLFDSIKIKAPKRSSFDLSYDNKFSFNMGALVPFYNTEVLPGDRFKINSEVFFRFAPMLAPIMHEVDCYIHYFFVPNRLLWRDWENFITGGEDGTTDITLCSVQMPDPETTDEPFQNYGPGSLCDFLGYRNAINNGAYDSKLNRLPLSAYQLIYNEYYRDQNVDEVADILFDETSHVLGRTDGQDDGIGVLRYRRWRKDYFTSALPFAQRGAEVNLPIDAHLRDSSIMFTQNGVVNGGPTLSTGDSAFTIFASRYQNSTPAGSTILDSSTSPYLKLGQVNPVNSTQRDTHGYISGRVSDDSINSNITINDLRRTSALQSWLERNARAGARYVEQILAHFGVRSSDARLQRPEYLGGGKTIVKVSEVLQQNSDTTADTPLGTMAGRAIAVGNSNNISYTAEEHGYIMGIMSVVPKASYYQGTNRSLLRRDKFDFFYPEFAHLGEQAIMNAEIYESRSNREGTFGYIPRYSEYKFRHDEIHGDFTTTLDFWHLGRRFTSAPSLNPTFLECNEHLDGLNRIFAVSEGNHIWAEVYNNVYASRLMPEFGTPLLM